ncbi:MAG: hypothetical protein ACRETA_04715 [Gammaproteobacteria bacterium]
MTNLEAVSVALIVAVAPTLAFAVTVATAFMLTVTTLLSDDCNTSLEAGRTAVDPSL